MKLDNEWNSLELSDFFKFSVPTLLKPTLSDDLACQNQSSPLASCLVYSANPFLGRLVLMPLQ